MAKNIVLLSDGTGNSSANPFKTNVWRLYQAIDTTEQPGLERQAVFYGDGVGTGNFRPLVLLGLALGIGVARNVKELYAFLCRNYVPGDNIYLFGFSRGAFTVRILAGLILRCGVVTADSDAELQERVQVAYDEYKRDMARRATATRPLLAGHFLGGHGTGKRTDHIKFSFVQQFPRIHFIGVWDTVDAYGMPVDELKTAIDRYIWPMTLADRELSPFVDRVCHALSLDDERPTFRPVLWNDPHDDPRLEQIWFAGVHADVGGGYPDDGLANVPLQWMMDEALAAGLSLHAENIKECWRRANGHGEQHDSRAGLAGYYRYGPRNVDALCADGRHGVTVATPVVHHTVIERIQQWRVRYAPLSFPSRRAYQVATRAPRAAVRAANRQPSPELDMNARDKDMATARDGVIRRRLIYFATVALTVLLPLMPAIDWITGNASWANGIRRIPVWSEIGDRIGAGLTWVLSQDLLPAWATTWVASFARHPMPFLVTASVLLWLFVRRSAQVQEQILARAEWAWRRI